MLFMQPNSQPLCMLQHTMATKAIARYIDTVQAIFPFDTMGFGNFVKYGICKESKMVMVSITLPIDKVVGDCMMSHKDHEKIGKRHFLVYHFLTDDLWSLSKQAISELNRLRNDRDECKIRVLQTRITMRHMCD